MSLFIIQNVEVSINLYLYAVYDFLLINPWRPLEFEEILRKKH